MTMFICLSICLSVAIIGLLSAEGAAVAVTLLVMLQRSIYRGEGSSQPIRPIHLFGMSGPAAESETADEVEEGGGEK